MTMQRYDAGDSRISVGQTHLSGQNLILPRVKIVQQMSQEFADKKADPGDFFNTLTGEDFGAALRFIPLFPFMQRVFIVRSERKAAVDDRLVAVGLPVLPEGDGLMCRSLDMYQGIGDPGVMCNDCPLSKWEGRTGAPPCSETYNVAALTERGALIILSFARSSAKAGRKMFSMLRFEPGRPWARVWEAKTRLEKNDKGNFYVPDIAVTQDMTPTEMIAEAINWAKEFEGGPAIDVTPAYEADAREEAVAGSGEMPF